jgi:hypothetical protein
MCSSGGWRLFRRLGLWRRSHVRILRRQNKFLNRPHWPNLGCHVAPSDWAMCHPVIGPYSPVTNTVSCPVDHHVNLPMHLPSQRRTTCVKPRACHLVPRHPTILYSQSLGQCHVTATCHVLPCVRLSLGHVSIRTTTCHTCPYSATCHLRMVPRVTFLLVHIMPENAKNE